MNKAHRLPKFARLTVWILAVLIAASSFSFLSHFRFTLPVYGYETNTFRDFQSAPLGLENPQFSNSAGGYPSAPSGWTETAYPNKDKGSTAMGVLDLDTYNTDEAYITDAKLTEYPEYKIGVPKAPFGTLIDVGDTSRKILMINTTKATETAIGYQSTVVTLAENKHFRISAWVKTGSLYGIHGAAIRLSGIPDYNIVFNDIKTANADTELTQENLYGWKQYTFYIKTSSIRSESASLALSLGDYYRGKDQNGNDVSINYTASGYAFFDNVEALEISPTKYNYAFKNQTASNHVQFVDLSLPTANAGGTDFSFIPAADGTFANYTVKSSSDANVMVSDIVNPVTLDTDLTFNTENNRYNLKEAPVSATGKYASDGNILILSSYKGGTGINANYKNTAVGFTSNTVNIEKLNYYRLSVWVKTDKISGGAGATIVIETNVEDIQNPGENLSFRATGSTGDAANAATYGWAEYAFYIRGSFYRNYTVNLGLWLGQEDNLTGGTAMFSNVRFEKLTATQYTEHSSGSAGGGGVDIDAAATETGVLNGNFLNYDEPKEENKFPLPVNSWTFNTPANINRSGYSKDESFMDTEAIVSGIMPTDSAHFWAHSDDYGTGATPPSTESGSVLYMASSKPNAFSYTSSAVSLGESGSIVLTARMRVDHITGYGASLVLRDDNGIISTIENITETGGRFHDYTFYLQSDAAAHALTLEIWLGLNERGAFNHTKLSSGNMYVDTVSITEIDAAAFAEKETAYQLDLNLGTPARDYAVFSYTSLNFTEFDPYDTSFIKYPYLWSVSGPGQASVAGIRSGIFDSASLLENSSDIPSHFINPDRRNETEKLKNNNVLILENAARTASTVSFDRPFPLHEETYYKLEVSAKVDIPKMITSGQEDAVQNGIGASIALKDTEYKFENIFDTATVHDQYRDEEVFKTFTFYVYTGAEARNVQLALSLGGEKPSQYTTGRIYVNAIRFTDITNTLYDEETAKIKRDADNALKVDFGNKSETKDTSVTNPDKLPTAPDNFNWLLVPTILFAAALLLALGGLVFRRVFDNLSAKRAKQVAIIAKAGYSRNADKKGYKEFSESLSDSDDNRAYTEFDDVGNEEVIVSKEKKTEGRKIYTVPVITEDDIAETEESEELAEIDREFIDSDTEEEAPKAKDKGTTKKPANDFNDSFDD